MTHAGAGLDDDAKARLTALNQRLSTLTTTFEKNLLADTNDLAVRLRPIAELDGLTDGRALRRRTGRRPTAGSTAAPIVTLTLFTGHPYLASLHGPREPPSHPGGVPRARLARQRRTTTARAARDRRGCAPTRAHCSATLARRIHHRRRDRRAPRRPCTICCAGSPSRRRNAGREQEALQAIIDETEAAPFALEAHDWAFYTEKVRAAEYDLDRGALRPWFEAERVLQDGVFHAATELYGVTFAERADLRRVPPRRARVRGAQRRRHRRSACTSSTSTRATRSAAERG